jgi:hypothetical protein
MQSAGAQKKHEFHIQIDRKQYVVIEMKLTGTQIRHLPSPPIGEDRDLYEVVPGRPDHKISDSEVVEMKDELRFFTAPRHINPGIL